ncbi:TrmB family transcriptional regulator [Picrophilus oshimae]|uniref:Transcriptional regulator n=1 Tax=Picrophilus torridus (strain ATCC 700027 / DSM 9790 / JCM 10055 / NBRC 100828 / KAW 2/3) TaxID=1122961 RepID=A0A8G2FW04_PICTO|nr:TrmB family transcriptional regulator [Picrophilus oshimae]SMD30531.1 transcriptional regulator [Picrophilus oshimae DSM 9789]
MPARSDGSGHSDIISVLQDMGLTENESRVYILLLEHGSMTAQDILNYLPLRQPQLYDVTAGLERKGFINILLGRPKKYEAIEPEAVVEAREQILNRNREYFLNWANIAIQNRHEKTALINAKNIKSVINNSIELINNANETLEIETTWELYNYIRDPIIRKLKGGCRIEIMFFGNDIKTEMIKNEFSGMEIDIKYIMPGQFFAVISDETNSVFMPRGVAMNINMERYGYIIKDRDMSWFITHNFFTGWYRAMEILKMPLIRPYKYSSQRILIGDLKGLNGININGVLDGSFRLTGKRFHEQGSITGINLDSDVINFVFETKNGKFTVGGYDSQLEDVIMRYFNIN